MRSNTSFARLKHPQTNGKIERFYGEVERRIRKFGSIDKIVHWHNVIKPHMSLDFDEPGNAFLVPIAPREDPGLFAEMVRCVKLIQDRTTKKLKGKIN